MKLSGYQKLTLLDFPGLMACVVFTSGCNFRCPFCHNALLVLPGQDSGTVSEDEFFAFLEKRRGVLDGVVVTGGEPLLHPDIVPFLAKVKDMGFKTKVDTNGTKPALLKKIAEEKLVDYIAMDIKNAPEEYGAAVGLEKVDLAAIEQSMRFLMQGNVDYEFRTTVVKGIHTEKSLEELAKWIKGAKRYYLQAFKNSGGLIPPEGLDAFDETEMKKFADVVAPYVPAVEIRGV